MKLLTAQQAIALFIEEYPFLYASQNYDTSKFAVLDQIFNVIGNGIRDFDEFQEQVKINDISSVKEMPSSKYINDEKLFQGYTKTIKWKIESKTISMPDSDGEIIRGVTESEKKLYPQVELWLENEKRKTPHPPYPNFEEKYSLVHKLTQDELQSLGSSWLEAGKWFYEKSLEYFKNGAKDYSNAYPHREYDNSRYVNTIMELMEKHTKSGMSKEQAMERISKDYENPFDGDIEKFWTTRWEKERERIIDFIERTIDLLDDAIENKNDKNTTKKIKFK